MPPQQATTGPAPIEGIERTNVVVVRNAGQEMGAPLRKDPYAIKVNQGRNCYTCGGFGHMARHCRNQRQRGRTAENRRLEYGGERIKGIHEQLDNLKEVENLESLD